MAQVSHHPLASLFMEPNDAVQTLLREILDLQRQQCAAQQEFFRQTLANQQRALRRQSLAMWFGILTALVLAVVGVALMASIYDHASSLFEMWEDSEPIDDPYYDEEPEWFDTGGYGVADQRVPQDNSLPDA